MQSNFCLSLLFQTNISLHAEHVIVLFQPNIPPHTECVKNNVK